MLNLVLNFSLGVSEEGYKISPSKSDKSLLSPGKKMNTFSCMMIFK